MVQTTDELFKLPESWFRHLAEEFDRDYMRDLEAYLTGERRAGKSIFPPHGDWFKAFGSTDFNTVRVVILGQDPYHGPGQAHGLCFSVPQGVKTPPSLVNIFKEIEHDLGIAVPSQGCLLSWAEQGVLLLNATLTVEQGLAGSHQRRGWEQFTDRVIACLNEQRSGLVFMLWGAYAQKKGQLIDRQKHCVLTAPHPSPLSAHRGFLGCEHFSRANSYLRGQGGDAIDWQVTDC